jgi:hypothetical protein
MQPIRKTFFGAAALLVASAHAHATDSSIYLEYSNVTAVGPTITITRLPILKPDGKFIYKDVIIQLKSDSSGNLTYVPSTPQQKLSPSLISNRFVAGTYVYPGNTNEGFILSGPSGVPGRSVTKFEVNKSPSLRDYCGVPAIFYVGALSANPNYARIKAAGITSTEYSYGIIGGSVSCGINGGTFGTGALVGFSQSGNLLTIASFTKQIGGKDQNTPVSFITYRAK